MLKVFLCIVCMSIQFSWWKFLFVLNRFKRIIVNRFKRIISYTKYSIRLNWIDESLFFVLNRFERIISYYTRYWIGLMKFLIRIISNEVLNWIELIWSIELMKFAHNHIGFYGVVHGDAVDQTHSIHLTSKWHNFTLIEYDHNELFIFGQPWEESIPTLKSITSKAHLARISTSILLKRQTVNANTSLHFTEHSLFSLNHTGNCRYCVVLLLITHFAPLLLLFVFHYYYSYSIIIRVPLLFVFHYYSCSICFFIILYIIPYSISTILFG